MRCIKCGKVNRKEAKYCDACGVEMQMGELEETYVDNSREESIEELISEKEGENKAKRTGNSKGKIALIIIVLVFTLVFFYDMVGGGDSNHTITSIGDEVEMHFEGTDHILCATTKSNYSDLIDIIINKDEIGYSAMFLSGAAFEVGDKTNALVLEMSGGNAKVRILEGSHYGETAWVAIEAIYKQVNP